MLLRWVAPGDMPSWLSLAEEVAVLFGDPFFPGQARFRDFMEKRIEQYEAVIAEERMTNLCFGIIGFSRESNSIDWFAVTGHKRGYGIGTKLLRCALNQLDHTRDITVVTFQQENPDGHAARRVYRKMGFYETEENITDDIGNPRCKMLLPPSVKPGGGSFHHRFREYAAMARGDGCPVCNCSPCPPGSDLIAELPHAWLCTSIRAEGRLFGKCEVVSKVHSEHFHELAREDMAGFMQDVQSSASVLHRVTGAVRINYEIRGNTLPHLQVHLFPRYLDDDFPGVPIDYRQSEPSPYESPVVYDWFVSEMRRLLAQ